MLDWAESCYWDIRRLDVPGGRKECVVKVLYRCLQKQDSRFDVKINRGRKQLIKNNSFDELYS